ncbi:hypothetical protein SAMN05660330_03710 [Desulforhopalus singaporensis]|uniref:Uncharacterized protein n=1 Tax=Desulforhopalus singaporensis TaxID=91360 RepID=A0A1H0UTP2_9BACT|nr:hypothetical protein SAMN05660330_03710 [Desulforhopalus singaporensis]
MAALVRYICFHKKKAARILAGIRTAEIALFLCAGNARPAFNKSGKEKSSSLNRFLPDMRRDRPDDLSFSGGPHRYQKNTFVLSWYQLFITVCDVI